VCTLVCLFFHAHMKTTLELTLFQLIAHVWSIEHRFLFFIGNGLPVLRVSMGLSASLETRKKLTLSRENSKKVIVSRE